MKPVQLKYQNHYESSGNSYSASAVAYTPSAPDSSILYVCYLHIWNSPRNNRSMQVAKDVRLELELKNIGTKIIGRWSDHQQSSNYGIELKSETEDLSPNGDRKLMDVVFKDPEKDSSIYALNDTNRFASPENWKYEKHHLGPAPVELCVTAQGNGCIVSKEFKIIEDDSGEPKIESIDR